MGSTENPIDLLSKEEMQAILESIQKYLSCAQPMIMADQCQAFTIVGQVQKILRGGFKL